MKTQQRGVTLIEFMIAMTLGLVLMTSVGSLILQNSTARNELSNTSEQVENGRHALSLLLDDIQNAGMWGPAFPLNFTVQSTPSPCDSSSNDFLAINNPVGAPPAVYGYDSSAAAPTLPCLINPAPKPRTDILVIRRASSTPEVNADGTTFYLQSSACPADTQAVVVDYRAEKLTLRQKDCYTKAELRPYLVHLYYISNEAIPTLYFVEFLNGNMTQPQALVAGIQDMQVEYGIDINHDGTPDCFLSNPSDPAAAEALLCPQTDPEYLWYASSAANWGNITALRLHLLAVNTNPSANWEDTHTYDLGLAGTSGPFHDRFKRHVYTATARIHSIAGPREK